MKKLYTLILVSVFLTFGNAANAQVFKGKGDLTVNAGITLGLIGYGFGYYGNASFPIPVTVNVEYGVHEMFSVGGYLGYLQQGFGVVGNRYSFASIAFGVQGVFHATQFMNENLELDIDEEKVDFYGKLVLGFETYSWRYNGESLNNLYYTESGKSVFGPVFGVRYMFNPRLGGYAEGGRGNFGWLNLGLSLKL